MRTIFSACMILVLLVLLTQSANAHKPSDSYLRIAGGDDTLSIQWDIALKDLDFLLGIDANQNGEITWGEVKARRQAITDYALRHLEVQSGEQVGQLEVRDLQITQHSDGAYAVLFMDCDLPGDAEKLDVQYSLFFDVDPTHRGLVRYTNGDVQSGYVLSPEQASAIIDTSHSGLWRMLIEYIREGVWHIWIGFDHILFLISLLLPAVLIRHNKKWETVDAFRPAWKSVLKIVTLFTIAHSITLWLAVMQYVTLPSRFVEATIAFSIIVTALHNLFPVIRVPGGVIAFVFGLVHGFGFANVLVELGLGSATLAVSLFGFNVGVEIGQLAIVAVFLPLAYLLRDTAFYRWVIFTAGSIAIMILAAIWFCERAFNLELIGI